MTVIDAHGKVLQASWLAGDDPPSGRCAGALLTGNPATASSILMRAELVRDLGPIPAEMSWADWWLALRAAQVSRVAYLPEPRTLYRFTGENMSLGTQGAKRRGELVKACAFQRSFLRTIDFADATVAQLHEAWRAFERNAYEATELAGSPFAAPLHATPEDRDAARALCAAARAAADRGAWREAAIGYLHAAASDPWLEEAREGLLVALATLPEGAELPGQRPLEGARGFVVLARADEMLAAPSLLADFGAAMDGLDEVTLALDASDLPPEPTAARLSDAVLGHRHRRRRRRRCGGRDGAARRGRPCPPDGGRTTRCTASVRAPRGPRSRCSPGSAWRSSARSPHRTAPRPEPSAQTGHN